MKLIAKTVMASLFCISASAVADEQTSLGFTLEATIPDHRYYVKYADPSFGSSDQEMDWDRDMEKLNSLSTMLKAKNTKGKISAHLSSDAELVHSADPSTTIPLTITIAGRPLAVGQAANVEIVTAADATTEKTVQLVVAPSSSATYEAGDYTGTVTMMFDHEVI
jgi:hypothetical protein